MDFRKKFQIYFQHFYVGPKGPIVWPEGPHRCSRRLQPSAGAIKSRPQGGNFSSLFHCYLFFYFCSNTRMGAQGSYDLNLVTCKGCQKLPLSRSIKDNFKYENNTNQNNLNIIDTINSNANKSNEDKAINKDNQNSVINKERKY